MKLFPWILLAIAIAVIVFLRSCGPAQPPVTKTDTLYQTFRDTVRDTIPNLVEVIVAGNPVEITKTDTVLIHDTLHLSGADSAAIFADHFRVRVYSDTLRDKFGYAVIGSRVTQNKLVSQQAIFSFNVPEIHTTITEKERILYLGFNVGFGNNFGMGGVHATYIDKKDNEFGLQGDYTTQNFFIISLRTGWKIKL